MDNDVVCNDLGCKNPNQLIVQEYADAEVHSVYVLLIEMKYVHSMTSSLIHTVVLTVCSLCP
jgi:hypothetical protein